MRYAIVFMEYPIYIDQVAHVQWVCPMLAFLPSLGGSGGTSAHAKCSPILDSYNMFRSLNSQASKRQPGWFLSQGK